MSHKKPNMYTCVESWRSLLNIYMSIAYGEDGEDGEDREDREDGDYDKTNLKT